jgi:ATP-dependent DNA helicase RecG
VPLELSTPVQYIKRVGERIAEGLAARGVVTVEDLLYHLPFRYEDRLHPKPLADYRAGDMASLVGEVRCSTLLRTRSGTIFEMTVGITPPEADSEEALSGLLRAPMPILAAKIPETVKCMWFHGAYLNGKFRAGQRIALYGKLDLSRSGNSLHGPAGTTRFKMIQPTFELLPGPEATGDDAEFQLLEMGRIVPVYESLGGKTPWGSKLTSRWTRRVMWTVFRELTEHLALDPSAAARAETLPRALLERLALPSRVASLQTLHFPPAGTPLDELQAARTPAHRRLIFEEFFYLELGLELKRRSLRRRHAAAFTTNDAVRAALKQVLPFKPTGAQKRALGEIVEDMRRPQPMRRLLQGDVGSGKTIVAIESALVAIENGYQVALMAPTAILATQHYLAAKRLLGGKRSPTSGMSYRITLLTGALDDQTKRLTRARLRRGEIDLAIGTHALVEESVDFARLGLVIVDEQHRFGVQQRFQLMRKSATSEHAEASTPLLEAAASKPEAPAEPHVLVMTATPIPRTLALTMYGDLEASVLDELPPGRTPIVTRRVPHERADEVWAFLRKQVELGHQAYIVYPVIEGDKDDEPELDFPRDDASSDTDASTSTDTTLREKNVVAHHEDDRVAHPFAASPRKGGVPTSSPGKPAAKKSTRRSASQKATAPELPLTRRKPQRAKLRSATEMHAELSAGPLAGLKIGLLHGRMSAEDKEIAMARFQRNELQVLVSTTVIEVGVDVPNASVMVIDHAERFGLAQLHQLRGRVGRGAAKSYCLLVTGEAITPEADQRLNAMVQTQDGFALAEFDLNLRGPGEFFGTRQAGMPELRVASLTRDRDLLELARTEAERFVSAPDPAIAEAERQAVWTRLRQQWQRRYGLIEA